MASTLVHAGTLIDATGARPGWVLVDDGRIASVGTAADAPPEADRTIDASGGSVTPGFVDIHGHGAGGKHYQDGVDEALDALTAMRAHGTTRAVASFVTSSIDDIVAAIGNARLAMDRDPGLVGVHVEGPFLAPGRTEATYRTGVLCGRNPSRNAGSRRDGTPARTRPRTRTLHRRSARARSR